MHATRWFPWFLSIVTLAALTRVCSAEHDGKSDICTSVRGPLDRYDCTVYWSYTAYDYILEPSTAILSSTVITYHDIRVVVATDSEEAMASLDKILATTTFEEPGPGVNTTPPPYPTWLQESTSSTTTTSSTPTAGPAAATAQPHSSAGFTTGRPSTGDVLGAAILVAGAVVTGVLAILL
ncbi:hypothetical protein VTK56DRAFT_2998 [Thermocarpiscus australiensis]